MIRLRSAACVALLIPAAASAQVVAGLGRVAAAPAAAVSAAAAARAASAAPALAASAAAPSVAVPGAFAAITPLAAAPAAAVLAAPAAAAPAPTAARAAVRDASRLAAALGDSAVAPEAAGADAAPQKTQKAKVLSLRPTQMSVGMREVSEKVDELSSKDADAILKKHPVPVVIAPGGKMYLIDHHHLARAAWEAGIDEMHVEIVADLSKLSEDAFWARMKKEHWVYPYDQFGKGPHDVADLPENVRGLADDPYRSVAGEVRRRGGYEKTEEPFAEFQWANFFRAALKTHPAYHDFEAAVVEAVKLAKTAAAKALPGWSGKN